MKTRIFFLIAALMAIVASAQAQVYDFYAASPNGQTLWYKINPDSVSVTVVRPTEWGYPNEDSKPAGNLIIPDTVYHGGNAYAVTDMRNDCLNSCPVTSLHFPATYTADFDEGSFIGMSVLSQISVDSANPVYDSRDNCNALIHTATNSLCKGSASTVIPNGITIIRSHAFHTNQLITSITIPASVSRIEGRALCDCINMTSVTFQDGDTELVLEGESFMNCPSLASLYIPSRMIGIGGAAFCRCWNLASITVDPANPVYDSRDNCNAIIVTNTNVLKVGCINTTIPTTVTKLSTTASIGNHYETNAHIVIPDWVTGFAPDAGCWIDNNTCTFAAQDVADITFPAGWENYDIVFARWYHGVWNKLIFLGSTPPTLTVDGSTPESRNWGGEEWGNWWDGQVYIRPIEVPCGTLATWQNDSVWGYFTNISEPGVPQLTVNADEHGTAEVETLPTCGNDTATVSATATEVHYHFSHWSDGSTQNPYTLVLNGNTDLTAYFAIDSATVSVTTADATKGSVLGGGTVPLGGTATITAIPTEDNVFLAWSNGVTANPYTLTVTSDTSLTAHFSQPDTIILHDTIYVPVHDTTYVEVHDTSYIYEPVYSIEYVDRYIHDTTFVNTYVHDTTIQYVNQYVHDTTLVSNYVHDTTIQYVNQYVFDTVYLNNNIHDTLLQYVNQYVHDTTYVNNYLHDTIRTTTQRFDTTIVNLYQFDTAIYNTYHFDTLIVNNHYYDTVFVHLHDTIYITQEGIDGVDGINAKVYSNRGQIVVEGAEGNTVMLSDVTGRVLATKQDNYLPLRFDAPVSGTYMIKIGNYPVRKVVVIK